MDKQTRFGIGAAAVFALASGVVPLVSWWVSGPIMALSAIVAIWGFWPLFASTSFGDVVHFRVPMRRAAQIAYERCEGTRLGEFVARMFKSPDERLSYFYHAFGVRRVPMFARQPPSRRARPIPLDSHKSLVLMDGTNDLATITNQKRAVYTDTSIRRTDLWRTIRDLRKQIGGF